MRIRLEVSLYDDAHSWKELSSASTEMTISKKIETKEDLPPLYELSSIAKTAMNMVMRNAVNDAYSSLPRAEEVGNEEGPSS